MWMKGGSLFDDVMSQKFSNERSPSKIIGKLINSVAMHLQFLIIINNHYFDYYGGSA